MTNNPVSVRAPLVHGRWMAGYLAVFCWFAPAAGALPTVQELLDVTKTSRGAKDLLPADPAGASAGSATVEPAYELDTVTVTGTLRNQRLREIPGSVYVVNQREIEQRGSRTVGDALRGVPGVVSNLFGAGADLHSTYFIRGLPTTSTALLIDGRSVNNLNLEQFDLTELPVAGVDRVEVLTGGATTLYGSTAVGGVINVITKKPPKVFEGSAEAIFGSYGYSEYKASFGGPLAANLRFNLYTTYFNANNNFTYRVERPGGLVLEGTRLNGETTHVTHGLDLEYDVSERTTVNFSGYYRQSARGIALFSIFDPRPNVPFLGEDGNVSTASATALGLNAGVVPRASLDYYGLALSTESKIGAGNDSSIRARVSWDRGRTTEAEADAADTTDVGILGVRALHDWQISPGYNLTYGLDLNYETGSSANSENPRVFESDIFRPALFALNSFKLSPDVTLALGLRGTFGSGVTDRVSGLERNFGYEVDPSLGVRWQATPQIGLRTTFSRVSKVPNFNDLFRQGELQGNPSLVTETGSSFDVGFDWQTGLASLLRFSFFANDIYNLIGYNLIEAGFEQDQQLQEQFGYKLNDRVRVNYPNVRTSGIELGFNWQFLPNLTFYATETYTDARVVQGFKETLSGTQLPLVPFHSGRVGVSYEPPGGWRVALFAYFQGQRSVDTVHLGPGFAEFPDPQGNPIANIAYLPPGSLLPGYTALDLSLRVPVTPNVAITGYIDNLTNSRYERSYGNGAPPINFRLGVSSSF